VRSSVYFLQPEVLTLFGFDAFWSVGIYRRLHVAVLESSGDLGRRVKPGALLDPIATGVVMGNHECKDDILSLMQGLVGY